MSASTSAGRDRALLGAAGASMLLTQYIAAREVGSTFFSTELVLLGATLLTLAGPSLGYVLAHRVSDRALFLWGALSAAVQLALPTGLRALVGAMSARGFEGLSMGLCAAFVGLFLSGFSAVFLPRVARAPQALPKLYAIELSGALFGLGLIALSPSYRWTIAFSFAALILVLHLGLGARRLTIPLGIAAATLVVIYPRLDRAAAARYFAGYHGQRGPVVVETEYSPYQRIDVVDDARGRRSLYLDGVPFYQSGSLNAFNIYLAEVPGALHAARGGGRQALVLGSGSFSSAARLHAQGYEVTVVELDAAVARIGFARFAEYHGLREGDVHVVIDDGRRYLADTDRSFDVIALDVPAPYHVRTALLHTPSFYRLARARLRLGGVVSLSLSDDAEGDVGRAIAASAGAVFPDLVIVESPRVGIGILYAGAPLPFSADDVAARLAQDRRGGVVWSGAELAKLLGRTPPLSEGRLMPVISMARAPLEEVFRARWGAPLVLEAMATGFYLGLAQVSLGFSLLVGAGASALRFLALTAAWIAGGALGVTWGRAHGLRWLGASLFGIAVARAALTGAPFQGSSSAAGLVAGALTGAFAGAFLGDRAPAWGEVRALLLHENNGFLAGFAAAWGLLFASASALDRAVGALGLVLLVGRALGGWAIAGLGPLRRPTR